MTLDRVWAGSPPSSGKPLSIFTGFPCPVSGELRENWVLWVRLGASTKEWLSVKLTACGELPEDPGYVMRKASYWFGWSPHRRSTNRQRDAGYLKHGRPELHFAVMRTLKTLCRSMDRAQSHAERDEPIAVSYEQVAEHYPSKGDKNGRRTSETPYPPRRASPILSDGDAPRGDGSSPEPEDLL